MTRYGTTLAMKLSKLCNKLPENKQVIFPGTNLFS